MTKFEEYLKRKRAEHGHRFDARDLAPQFVEHFNSGSRVKVRFSYAEEATGTIGVTTGWRPCFLLMRTRRSTGSSRVLSKDDKVVAVKRSDRYEPTE